MSKILLIHSGLKHAQEFTEPFLKRLQVHLDAKSDCVDVRNTSTFDERTFFEYDQVVFIFSNAMSCIPSSTLEIFHKLENQSKNHTEIYALIACDEYEPEKCELSKKIIEKWCERENLQFQGVLQIGACLYIMNTMSRYVVAKHIKDFAQAIFEHRQTDNHVTMLSDKVFMRVANQYWSKQIKKKQKQMKKDR